MNTHQKTQVIDQMRELMLGHSNDRSLFSKVVTGLQRFIHENTSSTLIICAHTEQDIEHDSPAFSCAELEIDRAELPELNDRSDKVSFSLKKGKCSYVNVTVDCHWVSDEVEVNNSNDPQDAFLMSYDAVEVKQDAVGIIDDFDEIFAKAGMPIRLTGEQVDELNKILKDMFESEFLKGLAA